MIQHYEDKEVQKICKIIYFNEQIKRLLEFLYIVSHNLRSHGNISSLTSLLTVETEEEKNGVFLQLLKTVSNSCGTLENLNEVVNLNWTSHRRFKSKSYIDKSLSVFERSNYS
jgi:transcriptional regulator of NAD metabolism